MICLEGYQVKVLRTGDIRFCNLGRLVRVGGRDCRNQLRMLLRSRGVVIANHEPAEEILVRCFSETGQIWQRRLVWGQATSAAARPGGGVGILQWTGLIQVFGDQAIPVCAEGGVVLLP